jgi:RNA polymerase sigma factor (sigma-70 family)
VSSAAPLNLEQAYSKYGRSVLRRARTLLGNEEDAREMVHEIFVGLLEAPEQYQGRSSLATWLYSATTHRCLNRIRDRKNQLELLRERVAPAAAAAASAGTDAADLRRLLSALPEELAAVAVYHYMDEMTQQEIAGALGRSRRHVANLLQRLSEFVRAWEGAA